MDAIEERTGVGRPRNSTGYDELGDQEDRDDREDQATDSRDRPRALLYLVQKDAGGPGASTTDEFDGIRSEVDFRRAMAREEERLRGTWIQRALRALGTMRANLWNSRALRLLR